MAEFRVVFTAADGQIEVFAATDDSAAAGVSGVAFA